MKEILENIVKDCNEHGLKVYTDIKDGEIAYRIQGFSKSGNALLYIDGEEIICETRYEQKDHILHFSDLVLIAKQWYEMYKDRKPFEHLDPEWEPLINPTKSLTPGVYEDEDLPF
jgi:hypothetical protein